MNIDHPVNRLEVSIERDRIGLIGYGEAGTDGAILIVLVIAITWILTNWSYVF